MMLLPVSLPLTKTHNNVKYTMVVRRSGVYGAPAAHRLGPKVLLMNNTVAVVICTYGDPVFWIPKSQRALSSVVTQSRPPDQIILYHLNNGTLAEVRNHAVSKVLTDYVIMLDGDDELEQDYVKSMLESTGDIRYPMVRYVTDGDPVIPEPVELIRKPLKLGNYMVIGSMIKTSDFKRVGGFHPQFPAYEDWHLFCKLVLHGATTSLCRNAVYRVHHNKSGRNQVSNPSFLFHRILYDLRSLEISSGISLGVIH